MLANPTTHESHEVYGYALEEKSGTWQGSFKVLKDGEQVRSGSNAASFDSEGEAVQQAISLGLRLLQGHIS